MPTSAHRLPGAQRGRSPRLPSLLQPSLSGPGPSQAASETRGSPQAPRTSEGLWVGAGPTQPAAPQTALPVLRAVEMARLPRGRPPHGPEPGREAGGREPLGGDAGFLERHPCLRTTRPEGPKVPFVHPSPALPRRGVALCWALSLERGAQGSCRPPCSSSTEKGPAAGWLGAWVPGWDLPQCGVAAWSSAPFLWARAQLCPDRRVSPGHECAGGHAHPPVCVGQCPHALHAGWGGRQLSWAPCTGSRCSARTPTGTALTPPPVHPALAGLHPPRRGRGAACTQHSRAAVHTPQAHAGPPRAHAPVPPGPLWWPPSRRSCCILSLETFRYWSQLQAWGQRGC